jgi:two-component system response regulator YesN
MDSALMLLYLAAEGTESKECTELKDNGLVLTNLRELAKRQRKHKAHFLAIGALYTDIKDLMNSYQSALQALQCLSYLGYGTSATEREVFCDWQKDLGEEEESSLKKAIQKRDAGGVEQALNRIFDEFIKEHAILNSTVRNICLMIYNQIRDAEKNNLTKSSKTKELNVEYTYILGQAATFNEIREMLLQYVQEVFNPEASEHLGSNLSVKQVIAYMHKHYQEKGLNINRMAEEVFLAPTYLSSLFKQDTGMTINQYLTKLRIEYAKSFLMDPKLKLYQVADMVGYEDAAYFARIFKNQAGITPQEYKERNIL